MPWGLKAGVLATILVALSGLASTVMLSVPSLDQGTVQIDGVRVLDAEFNEVANVQDTYILGSLERLWGKMVVTEGVSDPDWTHKLDIKSDDIGGRWLYSSKGYVARLNKQLKPIYSVPNNEAFMDLLGL